MVRPNLRSFFRFYLDILVLGMVVAVFLGLGVYGWYLGWYPETRSTIPSGLANRVEMNSLLGYFSNDYASAREKFLRLANREIANNPRIQLFSIPVNSPKDNTLFIDVVHIPPSGPQKRLLVVSSGVHGIEGGPGSAIQSMLIDRFAKSAGPEGTGILLIHSLNPWGFRNGRSVTEENIDLNLNARFGLQDVPGHRNFSYRIFQDLFNPRFKIGSNSFETMILPIRILVERIRSGEDAMGEAMTRGQAMDREGLFFMGTGIHQSLLDLSIAVDEVIRGYSIVLALDLHTGNGPRGKVQVHPSVGLDTHSLSMVKDLFEGYDLSLAASTSNTIPENWILTWLGDRMPAGTLYIPAHIEYGTYNNDDMPGLARVLEISILENQYWFQGSEEESLAGHVQRDFRDMLYPYSAAWRLQTIMLSRKLFDQVMLRFQSP